VVETDLALEWQDPDGTDVAHARDVLLTLAQELKTDLVHLNGFREATYDWPMPVVVTAHSCVNSWALACNDTAWLSEPRWRRYTDYVTASLDQADAWVAPTRAFRNVIGSLYRPRTPGNVIWNGSATAGDRADKAPFILAAGRMWDAAKNLAALSAAANKVDWPIVVAGAASDRATTSTRQLALMGELSHAELDKQMRRAAIFVSPAWYEPFGLSVLEAANAGCALVLSDIPTFRELWDDCASFVDRNDAGQLQALLNELCRDTPKREKLQQAATTRARRHTIDRMADGYAQLYDSLMEPAKARAAAEVCA
jgi:glycosyltransferase involved in cell wall biosynthesis